MDASLRSHPVGAQFLRAPQEAAWLLWFPLPGATSSPWHSPPHHPLNCWAPKGSW